MATVARLSPLLAAGCLAAACSLSWSDVPPDGAGGGSSSSSGSTSTTSSSSSASSSSTGSSSTSSSGMPPGVGCPATELTDGSPCTSATLGCEYGSDARPGCRHEYLCDGTVWKLMSSVSAVCSTTVGVCVAGADGMTCNQPDALCDEQNGLYCTCFSAGPALDHWQCDKQPTSLGCPFAPYPNIGQLCQTEKLVCRYGQCAANPPTGVLRECTANGVWSDGGTACP